MNAIDVALGCADSNFTKASVTGVLAAEVRRLREENERLKADAERLDELDIIAQREEGADMHLAHGHIALYLRTGIGSNAHGVRGSDIRKVIDAARGAK